MQLEYTKFEIYGLEYRAEHSIFFIEIRVIKYSDPSAKKGLTNKYAIDCFLKQ